MRYPLRLWRIWQSPRFAFWNEPLLPLHHLEYIYRHGLKADATYLVTSVYSLQSCDLDLDWASLSAKVLCSGIILGMFIWFFFDFVEAGSCQPLPAPASPALRGSNYQHAVNGYIWNGLCLKRQGQDDLCWYLLNIVDHIYDQNSVQVGFRGLAPRCWKLRVSLECKWAMAMLVWDSAPGSTMGNSFDLGDILGWLVMFM